MTFHAHPVPPVPDATAAATLAACPNGNPSLRPGLAPTLAVRASPRLPQPAHDDL
jgi:hypothetical protein